MIRISGRVLVKDTNSGIPDLVVAVFDMDPQGASGAGGLTAALPPATSTAAADISPASLSSLRSRLGSVLTDASGNFDLPITGETSQHFGTDRVPDLVVAVFAPEDAGDTGDPIPRPAEERLLYLSRSSRAAAGPVEAYIIRIARARLDAFGIRAAATPDSQIIDAITAVAAGWERQAGLQQQLKKRLAPTFQSRVDAAAKVHTDAKALFAGLAALPPTLRSHPYLVKDPKDTGTVQRAAVEAGLSRMRAYGGVAVLRLRNDELAGLGLTKDDTGVVTGQVPPAAMAERLLAPSAGPDLRRKRSPLEARVSADDILAAAAVPKATHPDEKP